MGWSQVEVLLGEDLGLCQFVWEDARAEAGDKILDPACMRRVDDIEIHPYIVRKHVVGLAHIFEKSADVCGKMDHVSWLYSLE